jgi:hypothetical protein
VAFGVVPAVAHAAGQVAYQPGSIDQPPLVSPRAPVADEAPPQPLGPIVAPGRDRGRPTSPASVPSVRALFADAGASSTLRRGISDSRLTLSRDGAVRAPVHL